MDLEIVIELELFYDKSLFPSALKNNSKDVFETFTNVNQTFLRISSVC